MSEEELERRLAEADRNIENASAGFSDWAIADLDKAMAAVDGLEKDGEDRDEKVTGLVFRVAHDLKGQGTTFGYPLVTQIGGLLCDFIRSTAPVPLSDRVGVLRAHLAAMTLVLKQDIKGDGDATSRQLVEKLALVAEHVSRRG